MAAKTTLNEKNLKALGADRLAALVMELVTGSAPLKRQARAALLENSGGDALASEVRKRLAAIKRATSFVDWQKRRALVNDLEQQRRLIVEKIAPSAPATALELMWRFMGLAESIYSRADDSNGDIGEVFAQGCVDLGFLAAAAKPDPVKLADQVFAAKFDQNDYAEFDELVEVMTPVLGAAGLARLKERAVAAQEELAAKPPKPQSGRKIGWSSSGPIYEAEFRHSARTSTVRHLLQEIADAQGDVDAFIAGYDAKARKVPNVAAEIATRLVDADRAAEALEVLDRADVREDRDDEFWLPPDPAWSDARIAALDALGRAGEAQSQRYAWFERALSPDHLRAYLKHLPDFEDVEAEDRALDFVRRYHDIHAALHFLVGWPELRRAADLVVTARDDWDGNRYYFLPDMAAALAGSQPLAATILLRALILDTLTGAKSTRYKHAARHLLECASIAHSVDDWGDIPSHADFVAALGRDHSRKSGFWSLVPEDAR